MTTGTTKSATFLTPQEAADLIGVHVNTMLKYLKDGTVPATRLGARWYIDAANFAKVMKGGEA